MPEYCKLILSLTKANKVKISSKIKDPVLLQTQEYEMEGSNSAKEITSRIFNDNSDRIQSKTFTEVIFYNLVNY